MASKQEPDEIPRFPLPRNPEMGLRGLVAGALFEKTQRTSAYHDHYALYSYLEPIVSRQVREFFPGDPATAEHVTDLALDRILENLQQCYSHTHHGITGWVIQVARNLAIDELRKRYGTSYKADPPVRFASLDRVAEVSAATDSDVSDLPKPNLGRTVVAQILQRIGRDHEQALEMLSLHREGHETWSEIAEGYRINTGAAKERVRRAKSTIADDLRREIARLAPLEKAAALAYLRSIHVDLHTETP